VSFYKEAELLKFLFDSGFEFDGDEFAIGLGFVTPDGHCFSIPKPTGGWFNAEVIDRIFSDRWIWVGPIGIRRYDSPDGQ
jgi:hypothetical protein